MRTLPKARSANVVVKDLESETLIYDMTSHTALCLNETAALVYGACDGQTSFDSLKVAHGMSDEVILYALEQLRERNLVESSSSFLPPRLNVSRRQALRSIGLASAVALPIISSVTAPMAIHAASCVAGGQPCNLNNPGMCCSKACLINGGNPICESGCLPGGSSCDLNKPGACCSGGCLVNGGNPICDPGCLPSGSSCNLNNPGACCSGGCLINGGNPICSA
jgi:hypothetical protein